MICTAELNTHCFSWCGRNPKTSYGADVLRLTFHRESATDSECSLNCQAMCSLPQPYLLNRLWIDLNMIFSQRPYFFALHRHFPQAFCERYRFLNLQCSTSLSLSPGIAGRCNITFLDKKTNKKTVAVSVLQPDMAHFYWAGKQAS